MKKKRRVLEVLYGLGYGGIRACIQNYVTYMNKDEFQIDIYAFGCSQSPFKVLFESMGSKVYLDPSNDISRNHIIHFVNKLTAFIQKGNYQVVHAHCNLISAWVTLAAKRAGASIIISHSHSTSHFYGNWKQQAWSSLRQWIINRTTNVKMACGQLAGEAMYGVGSKFVILPNGINVNRFITRDEERIERLRKELNIPKGVKVYANVTRMDPPKNHLFAVEVFKEIHKIDTSAIFVYGGVTPPVSSTVDIVKNKIKSYGLDEFTRYTGPIMDIEQLYHLTDLWIYCSVYEGLPYGPIELQAASVPCIVSDVITTEIDLGIGLVKFLSLAEEPSIWAKAAVEFVKFRPNNSSDKIHQAFLTHRFSIQQNVDMLENIYKGMIM